VTTPHTPPAALDVAAAPDARDNLRRVRAMYDAAPPEGCDDGDRTPALERVVASLAGGYSTSDLDARDVRCLVVAFDDAEQIINALQGQAALLRGEVNELRAKVADLTGDYETRCDETRRLGDELLAGLAGLAGEIVDALARAAAAEAECARLTACLKRGNAAMEQMERELYLRIVDIERERDVMEQQRDAARAEAAGLRAVVEGRTVPPTPQEIAAHHDASGSGWLVSSDRDVIPYTLCRSEARDGGAPDGARWWPLDASGRPCAWPTPALDAAGEVTP